MHVLCSSEGIRFAHQRLQLGIMDAECFGHVGDGPLAVGLSEPNEYLAAAALPPWEMPIFDVTAPKTARLPVVQKASLVYGIPQKAS